MKSNGVHRFGSKCRSTRKHFRLSFTDELLLAVILDSVQSASWTASNKLSSQLPELASRKDQIINCIHLSLGVS
jgi:hypothetical protein